MTSTRLRWLSAIFNSGSEDFRALPRESLTDIQAAHPTTLAANKSADRISGSATLTNGDIELQSYLSPVRLDVRAGHPKGADDHSSNGKTALFDGNKPPIVHED